MSWNSKIAWREGAFLHPQHFQQADRHTEYLLDRRLAAVCPFPWGIRKLEMDNNLIAQRKIGFLQISGVFEDGTLLDMPNGAPLPAAVEVPTDAQGHFVWLTIPNVAVGEREIAPREDDGAARFVLASEEVIDSANDQHRPQLIDIAHPRVEVVVREKPRAGHQNIALARIVEVSDSRLVLDTKHIPPCLDMGGHPELFGFLKSVLGWLEAKHQEYALTAADPANANSVNPLDFVMLQIVNREIGSLRHLTSLPLLHPERVFEAMVRLAGELATIVRQDRMAREYPVYDHANLFETFRPVVDDIQRALAVDLGKSKLLPLNQIGPDRFWAPVENTSLFRNATFVLEVSTSQRLAVVQSSFPELCKIGPTTAMDRIVGNSVPGVTISHLPNPRGIRIDPNNVYFLLDKSSELWAEFSTTPAIGLQILGDWPELKLRLWAIQENF